MELTRTKFKQTEVGLIPEDWTFSEIGQYIDLLTGFPFPSSKYSKDGIRLLKGLNIKRGETNWEEKNVTYWKEEISRFSHYQLKVNDLVISMDGSLVGKSYAFISKSDLPALLLQRVARLRSERIDINYLRYHIASEWFVKHTDSVKTVTAIPHISPKDIRIFSIPLPPTLTEQQAIATALSDTDDLISSLEKLINKKKAIKQGVMQQLLTPPEKGGKRLPKFDVKWEEKTLGECLKIRHGKSQKEVESESGTVPIFGTGGLMGYSTVAIYDKPSVLIGRKGTIDKPQYKDSPFWTVDTLFYSEINIDYDPKLLYYYFLMIDWYTMNEASGVPSLNASTIEKVRICISPSLEEQASIRLLLDNIEAEIQILEDKRLKHQQIKQGMMQELLTGKTRLI